MFSSGPNYTKLKTNLRLAINRLKLLEKKKMELAQKSRKEIADFIGSGKTDRARIRVEHIIREDYLVEAMEMLEMYCDLILARFGLLQQMKGVDPGLHEAIASIIWAGPRLVADVPEMKAICDQMGVKYGKEFVEKCRGSSDTNGVNDKFQHRLGVQAPSKLLVEKYLMEISMNFNVPFEPDSRTLKEGEAPDNLLLDFGNDSTNNLGGGGTGGSSGGGSGGVVDPPGFRGFPPLPAAIPDFQPFNYPDSKPGNVGGFTMPRPEGSTQDTVPPAAYSYNIPVNDFMGTPASAPMHFESPPPPYNAAAVDANKSINEKPKPQPRGKLSPPERKPQNTDMFPELPSVPDEMPDLPNNSSDLPNTSSSIDDIDFDDLNRRFANLKKSK